MLNPDAPEVPCLEASVVLENGRPVPDVLAGLARVHSASDAPQDAPTSQGAVLVVTPDAVPATALEGYAGVIVASLTHVDGRLFSIGRQLRRRYRGHMRALGPLLPDQSAFAHACGFDSIEIPHELYQRHRPEHWAEAAGAIPRRYQPGFAGGESILQARWRT